MCIPSSQKTLHLLGNSFAAPCSGSAAVCWGQLLPHFVTADLTVLNSARPDLSIAELITQGHLKRLEPELKNGDIALIAFDTPKEASFFATALRLMLCILREQGVFPILLTPFPCASGGIITAPTSLQERDMQTLHALADVEDVPLVDLYAQTYTALHALALPQIDALYVREGSGRIHTTHAGAHFILQQLYPLLSSMDTPLRTHLRPRVGKTL